MARLCNHCGKAFADGALHFCHHPDPPKEGAKWDDGKVDWSYLPSGAVGEILKIYAGGAKKYGRGNYQKGIHYSRVFSAAMRHLWAWWRGEELDQESGLSHLAHAAWNIITLLEYTQDNKYRSFDDRDPVKIKHYVSHSSGTPLKIEYIGEDSETEEIKATVFTGQNTVYPNGLREDVRNH